MASNKDLEFLSSGVGSAGSFDDSIAGSINAPSAGQGQGGKKQGDNAIVEMFKAASHPRIAVLHVVFKVAAICIYFFGSLFGLGYISWFVSCVIVLSMDFWVVKNITGRLMVGLRWWSDISEDGESVWRFESVDDPSVISNIDYRIFWYSMYLNTVVWVFFGIVNLFSLGIDKLLLIAVALTLSVSNIIGYWKCSKDAKQRLETGVQSFVSQSAMSYFSSQVSSGFSLLSTSESRTSSMNNV